MGEEREVWTPQDMDDFITSVRDSHRTHADNVQSALHNLSPANQFMAGEMVAQHAYLAGRMNMLASALKFVLAAQNSNGR